MGVREIRFCDISGTEKDVESHELHVDQMRIDIDLAGPEYQKLLKVLAPYIEAGRVEASMPGDARRRGARPARSSSTDLTAEQRQEVREWALAKGIEVPANNRFKGSLVKAWREETGTAGPDDGPDDPEDVDHADGSDDEALFRA